jgi:uncharacterized protein (TIGR00255 family)
LARDITRGKVDIWVSFESFTPEDVTVRVNEIYADAYQKVLTQLAERYGQGKPSIDITLELLAKTPDIIIFDKYETALEESQEDAWETLSEALDEALKNFNHMRETEGAALVADIRDKYVRAEELLVEIRGRIDIAVKINADKLLVRVEEIMAKLGGKPDDNRLLTEISLLADKSDINEELTRLESHLQMLGKMLYEEEAIGRKMDFLLQEVNREVNTIGAKSADVALTKSVLELKSIIEKIREQVQNIE